MTPVHDPRRPGLSHVTLIIAGSFQTSPPPDRRLLQADLDESERHLRKAIASANDDGSPFRGRRKEMREQLVLFLLQEGRDGRVHPRATALLLRCARSEISCALAHGSPAWPCVGAT